MSDTQPSWRATLSAYRAHEKIALTFQSIDMLNDAISIIWNDPIFAGMPCESPDGSVLFVPRESVPLLKAKGIECHEQRFV